MRMNIRNDALIGEKFGKLTIKGVERKGGKTKLTYFKCKCDCGNLCTVLANNVKRGMTTSCGCILKELLQSKRILNEEQCKEIIRRYKKGHSCKGMAEEYGVSNNTVRKVVLEAMGSKNGK